MYSCTGVRLKVFINISRIGMWLWQDKKGRLLMVTALTATKIDLKGAFSIPFLVCYRKVSAILNIAVWPLPWSLMSFLFIWILSALSARLGLGKGGLRMAPPEALAQLLQVRYHSPPLLCSFLLTRPLLPLRCPLGRAAPWPSGSPQPVKWGCF